MTADAQVAKIFEWRRGFNAMHLIDLGVRLGLFQVLAAAPGGMTAQELAFTCAGSIWTHPAPRYCSRRPLRVRWMPPDSVNY